MMNGIRIVLSLQCHTGVLSIVRSQLSGNPIEVVPGIQLQARLIGKHPQYSAGVAMNQRSDCVVPGARRQAVVYVKPGDPGRTKHARNSLSK